MGPNRGEFKVPSHACMSCPQALEVTQKRYIETQEKQFISQISHFIWIHSWVPTSIFTHFLPVWHDTSFSTAIWVGDKADKTMREGGCVSYVLKVLSMTSVMVAFNMCFSRWQCTIADDIQVSVTKNDLDLKKWLP